MPKTGENIYKRRDGRWEGRYIRSRKPNGQAVYGYVYAKTYREAREKLKEANISPKPDRRRIQQADEKTFGEISDEWLRSITPLVKITTLNRYAYLLQAYIHPDLGRMPIRKIHTAMIEDYCLTMLSEGGKGKTGLSPKMVSDVLAVIKRVIQYAVKQKYIIRSEEKYAIRIKHKPKELRVFSRGEQEALIEYLEADLTPQHIGILLCLFTGLRVGELCALRWEDISLKEKTIRVHQTMQRIQNKEENGKKTKVIVTTPKSNCSIRVIPLPDHLVQILKKYQTTPSGYFLTNGSEQYIEPRTMQNWFKRAQEHAEIKPANFHTLRHTFATRCVEIGFDIKSLSEILGHANVNITMNRYVHPSLDLKRENMQRLSALFAVK